MVTAMKYVMSLVTCVILVSSFNTKAVAEDGKVVTYYKDPYYHREKRPEWQYLWNAKGKIGDSKNYVKRELLGRLWTVVGEDGNRTPPWEGTVEAPKEGLPRYSVVAYTIQDDYADDLWLINGNIKSHKFGSGVNLKVYVNDILKYSKEVSKSHMAHLFQCNLGKTKKGDVVYVAVGPGKEGANRYAVRYTLALYGEGKKPENLPINILSPDILHPTPKLDSRGAEDKGYVRWHKSGCTKALKADARLILLGDSITWGWSEKRMNEELGKYKPANLGISGDWIQNVLWRVENGVFDKVKPKAIVLLIGTNNLSSGYGVEEISSGIKEIIKKLNEKTPDSKIILMGIFPRGESIKNNNYYNNKILKINDIISKLGDDKKIFYLNINDKFIKKDGSICKELLPDLLHPSKEGILIWGNALKPVLDKLGVDKP